MSDSSDSSDSGDSAPGRISDNTSPAAQPFPQPSLDALALAEALAHLRAAGEEPRLSQLLAILRISPDAAGPLADALLADAEDAEDAEDDEAKAAVLGARTAALSPGTQRGLAAIFGTADAPTPVEYSRDEQYEPPALVAEQPAPYQAHGENGEAQSGSGLLDLARSRGCDAEALAARIMLTPAAIQWLDRVALPLDRQPEALVSHLVGALGVERAGVHAALAVGEPLSRADASESLADLLARHGSLSATQRSYWDTLLASTV